MKHPALRQSALRQSAYAASSGFNSIDVGPLPSRLPAVIVGVVGMVGVIGLGASIGVASVERHLRRDVEIHVLADVPSVRAEIDGRSVSLVGLVNSADDRSELGDRVQARWGVVSVRTEGIKVRRPAADAPAANPTVVSETPG